LWFPRANGQKHDAQLMVQNHIRNSVLRQSPPSENLRKKTDTKVN
jgi:hypothetical protein